ncbi:MAG: hypothetical protein HYR91_14315 [Flavobacteriia bacterium]|nr:hypothetical protein [Flavobacteriia bacterium]
MYNFKSYSLTLLLLIFSFITHAQDDKIAPKYSNEFLSIGVGADALGQGSAIVAQTGNAASGYWNPAGLTKVNKWLDISLMHSEYFAGIAKYDYLGLAHSIDSVSTFGFSTVRFAVDNIPNTTQLIDQQGNINYSNITSFSAADYAFLFSYARKLKLKGLSVGGNFKIIHRIVGDFAKSWGFGLDGGIQYQITDKWKFGLMARDLTSTFNAWIFTLDNQTKDVFSQTGNAIPQNGLELTLPKFIFGGYRKFEIGKKGIYSTTELNFDLTTDGKRNTLIKSNVFSIDPKIGIVFGFKKIVAVRGGISNIQYIQTIDNQKKLNFQPSIGIGLNIKNFSLDYAFTDIGDASVALYSHVISLRIQLIKPNNMN